MNKRTQMKLNQIKKKIFIEFGFMNQNYHRFGKSSFIEKNQRETRSVNIFLGIYKKI